MNIITLGIVGDKENTKIRTDETVLGIEGQINDSSKEYIEIAQMETKGCKHVRVKTFFIKKSMVDFVTISEEED